MESQRGGEWNNLPQPKTILLVDGDEPIRAFVFAVLTGQSYNVLVASSGEEALQKSAEFKGIIHLLSNVQMPGITGIELGSKIQLKRPEIRVMLMSGFSSGMLILNEGWHFLHKPFMPSQLLALVRSMLTAPFPPTVPDLNDHQA